MDEYNRQSRWVPIAASSLGVLLIGMADYWTGYEVSLSIFYAVPVILTVWFCGKWPGIAVALFALLTGQVAAFEAGLRYHSPWIPFWNAAVRFGWFVLIAIGTSSTKSEIEHAHSRTENLEGMLPICAGCKKIQDEHGDWADLESYIAEHPSTELTRKLCPTCAKRLYVQSISPAA